MLKVSRVDLSRRSLVTMLALSAVIAGGLRLGSPLLTVSTGTKKGPDLSTPEKLIAFGDDAFVGRVIKVAGRDNLGLPYPMTQFIVEVETIIKGSLRGRVTVNQEAGTDLLGLRLWVGSDEELMRRGHRYLLVTRGSIQRGEPAPGSDWHWIVSPTGPLLVDDPEVRTERVARYRQAASRPGA